MATKQTVAVDVEISGADAVKQIDNITGATKSLKAQLKEATLEAMKFGDGTSKEAIEAQKRVAALKEEISDFKDRINALNPEAKFAAVAKVASGIAGGFAAAQGAMALFGNESEDVQKALLKVQAALALSQGLNELRGLGDAMKNFKLVSLDALDGIKKAALANPFTALLIGLAAVAVAVYAWVTSESDLEKQIKASEEAEKHRLDQSIKSYDRQIKLAKSLGETTKQLELDKQQAIIDTEKLKLKQLQRDKDKEFQAAKDRLQTANFGVDAFADKKRKLSQEEIDSANAIADAETDLQVLRNQNHKELTDILAGGVVKKKEIHKTEVKDNKNALDEIFADIKNFDRDVLQEQLDQVERIKSLLEETEDVNLFGRTAKEQEEFDKKIGELRLKNELESNAALLAAKKDFNNAAFGVASQGLALLGTLSGKNEKLANVFFILDKALAIGKIVVDTIKANTAIRLATTAAAAAYAVVPGGQVAAAAAKATGTLAINSNRLNAVGAIAALAGSTFAKFKGGSGGDVPNDSAPSSDGGGGGFSAPQTPPNPNTTNVNPDGTVENNNPNQRQQMVRVQVLASDVQDVNNLNNMIEARSTI